MSVRTRRLQADYEQMLAAFGHHPYIRIRAAEGQPPERYEVEYLVSGLVMGADGEVHVKREHVAQIVLTLAYPRQAPQCRMLTPVFHPNIAPHAICIGDHWAAGESLADLVARIGQMIAYQSYNTKSPLSGEAARWADEHMHRLPVDSVDLGVDLTRFATPGPGTVAPGRAAAPVGPAPPAMLAPRCANCGQALSAGETLRCPQGHQLCPRCSPWCPVCGRVRLCLACEVEYCEVCRRALCPACRRTCAVCGKRLCVTDAGPPAPDGTVRCPACVAAAAAPAPTPAAVSASVFAPQGPAAPPTSGAVQFQVQVQCGEQVREVPLGPEGLLLGRAGSFPPPDVDLSSDPAVSRGHVRLSLAGGVPMVTDMGSTNGTLLNGRRLAPNAPERVGEGDVVELGKATRIWVYRSRAGYGSPTASPSATT